MHEGRPYYKQENSNWVLRWCPKIENWLLDNQLRTDTNALGWTRANTFNPPLNTEWSCWNGNQWVADNVELRAYPYESESEVNYFIWYLFFICFLKFSQ